jgi:hypothetical protein
VFTPAEQHHLFEARQMQALSFAGSAFFLIAIPTPARP